MPQSLASVPLHIIFSTKNRRAWLCDRSICRDLYAYMAVILRDRVDSPALIVNGFEDHIHVLCLLSRKLPIMKVIEESKTETSKWLKRTKELKGFAWQSGYAAFGVSESSVPQVRKYIADQVNHHRTMTFEDEYRKICKKHGLSIDEDYVWD